MDQRFLLLVTGARQVGKTTLLRRSYPDLPYFNLDAMENRDFLARRSATLWHEAPGPAFIDEIQKQPDLMDKLKFSWDEGELARSVMTGSSQLLLLRQVRESLAGRVRLLELFPLSVGERAGVAAEGNVFSMLCSGGFSPRELSPELPPSEAEPLKAAEAEGYAWGGMPALLRLDEAERRSWLADYRSTYLQRDLSDLARIGDLLPFSTFQRILALRVGGIVNYADLARDSGVSADTARRYLEYLRISYQAELLQPWHGNPTRRLVKSPKVIALDMGTLRSAQATWELDSGEFFENFVIAEMIKQARTLRSEARLWFRRTSAGAEVDVVLETPRGIYGMEIKNRAVTSAADARHLRSLAADSGARWLGGLVLHRGPDTAFVADPGIWSLPSWRLWDRVR